MATIKIPSGATLSGLARQHKTTVQELLRLNPNITNPNLIYAGASLTIPTTPTVIPVGISQITIPKTPTAQPTVTAPLDSTAYTQQVLQAGNILGQASSQQTGIPYTPVTYTPPTPKPISPEVTPTAPTPAPTLPTPTATPTLDAYYTSMSSQVDTARKTLEDTYNKQIADLQAKQTAAQKKIDEFTTKQETIVGAGGKVEELTAPFRADLEKTERERLKVEENFFANQTLTNELDSLLTEGNTLVQQMKGVTGLAGIRGPRVNKTISDISARVGVIQAVMNVRNGQITQAYNLIDRSVSAMTADRNDRLSYYKTLFNFYKEQKDTGALISLKADEKKILSAQINLIQNDLVQAQNNADYIKNLMINPESASFMASAGVTLNDTPAQVNTKIATETARRERDDFKNKKIADGYEYVPFPTAGQDTVQFTVGGQTLSFKRPLKKPTTPTSSDKATAYYQIKQKAAQLFKDGMTADEYNQVQSELMSYGLGNYLNDFDKWISNMGYLTPELQKEFGIMGKIEPTVQSVLDALKKNFQQYKDANYSRKDVENQYKAENKLTDIPEPVKKILDEVYGETKSWWKFW